MTCLLGSCYCLRLQRTSADFVVVNKQKQRGVLASPWGGWNDQVAYRVFSNVLRAALEVISIFMVCFRSKFHIMKMKLHNPKPANSKGLWNYWMHCARSPFNNKKCPNHWAIFHCYVCVVRTKFNPRWFRYLIGSASIVAPITIHDRVCLRLGCVERFIPHLRQQRCMRVFFLATYCALKAAMKDGLQYGGAVSAIWIGSPSSQAKKRKTIT